MPSDSEPAYGQSMDVAARASALAGVPAARLVAFATGVALMVAAGILPGCQHRRLLGRAARRGDRRGAERGHPAGARRAAVAAHARARLPARAGRGRRASCWLTDDLTDGVLHGRQLRLGAARGARGRGGERRARRAARARMTRTRCASRSGSRAGRGSSPRPTFPGIVFLEIDGLALPVLRRAMRDGNAPNMARWLADDTHRLTEWETDLSSQTGASQAGILLGSNEDISGVPLGREGDRHADDVLGAAGLRGDRAAARDRRRPARRRRLEPRQPALRRGRGRDPHGQPDGGREAVQPRLPGVSRQRRQRDAHARALRAWRSSSSGRRRCGRSAATCGRAAIVAASTR